MTEQPFRDRILELRRVRAGDLAPHEANPRRHPDAQRQAVEGSLLTLGQVAPLLAYQEGDRLRLFDGHLRREIDPEAEVTVAVTDLSPAEARQALATLDRSGALADTDEALLADLLAQVREDAAAGVLAADARLDGLLAELVLPEFREFTPEDFDGIEEELTDLVFHVPLSAVPVIEEQIERIRSIEGLRTNQKGLALARLAERVAGLNDERR